MLGTHRLGPTAVQLHDLPDDRQAQPGTGHTPRGWRAVEAIKDEGKVGGLDPRPLVSDRIADHHGYTVLALHAAHRGPALWLNASRAAIAALELGIPAKTIRQGISAYQGVSRRLELRHSGNGVLMLDDYAHNPAQIDALARALRGYYPKRRLIAVFEPRQHRRTALFYPEFGQALAAFDACLLLPISPGLGDEEYGQHASLGMLRDAVAGYGQDQALSCNGYEDAAGKLAGMVCAGDVVVSLGTGSPYLVLDHLAATTGRAAS